MRISLDCPHCGRETVVDVTREVLTRDPRDGTAQVDWVVENVGTEHCCCESDGVVCQRAITACEEVTRG